MANLCDTVHQLILSGLPILRETHPNAALNLSFVSSENAIVYISDDVRLDTQRVSK